MLVLSRGTGQKIIIDDDIVIEVIEVQGKRARIGITAPPDIKVHRSEVYDQIQSGQPERRVSGKR